MLRAARLVRGWSCGEVADRVGVTRQFVHRLEEGTRRPSVSVARALAHVLELAEKDRAVLIGCSAVGAGYDFPGKRRRLAPRVPRVECRDWVDELRARREARRGTS